MGEIVGYVTRSRGAAGESLFGVSGGGTEDISRNQFNATKSDSSPIGTFDSLAKARDAVRRSTGGPLLKWTRIDLASHVEHWEGRSAEFYPGDLGELLEGGIWLRADQGIVGLTPVTDNLARWISRDGAAQPNLIQAVQAVVADQPTKVEVADGGRPTIWFDPNSTELMTTNLTIGAPWTMFATVNPSTAAHGGNQIAFQTPQFEYYIDVAPMVRWMVNNAGGHILGPAAVMGAPVVISAIGNTALLGGLDAYIDGTAIGASALAAGAGILTISDAVEAFAGGVDELLIVPHALGLPKHDAVVQYMMNRYAVA